jgi:hypothetical protein
MSCPPKNDNRKSFDFAAEAGFAQDDRGALFMQQSIKLCYSCPFVTGLKHCLIKAGFMQPVPITNH